MKTQNKNYYSLNVELLTQEIQVEILIKFMSSFGIRMTVHKIRKNEKKKSREKKNLVLE